MNRIRILLWPLTPLYWGVMKIRNFCFDLQLFKSYSFHKPVVCIGNLSTGGTGKTPHVEWFIRMYDEGMKIVVLSRGYGRKTKGVLAANNKSTPSDIGDEPFQVFQKFSHTINLVVCEDRVKGLKFIETKFPDVDVVLMDDGFQHRAVKAQFYILLSECQFPFYKDFVIPLGNLRESRREVRRANHIIYTKYDKGISLDFNNKYSENISNSVTCIEYGEITRLTGNNEISNSIIVITGIAKSELFVEKLKENFTILQHLNYPDHYKFGKKEMDLFLLLHENHKGQVSFVMTEKDAVKISSYKFELSKLNMFYLPIEVNFVKGKEKLIEQLHEVLD